MIVKGKILGDFLLFYRFDRILHLLSDVLLGDFYEISLIFFFINNSYNMLKYEQRGLRIVCVMCDVIKIRKFF